MRRVAPRVLLASLPLALTLACGDDGPQGSASTGSASTDATSDSAGSGSASTTATASTSSGGASESSGASASESASASASASTGSSGGGETTGAPACGDDVTEGPTIVMTSGGAIEGELLASGVVAFRGVAYAEAPTGDRRLRPPEPRACVPGITPAQDFGPTCVQLEKDAFGELLGVVGDEDCLTLNVWTPAAGGGDRPVLVFIHGGGNAVGASSYEIYDGARLAEDQDVVVVTLNYRLGALGWLTHPQLAAESADGVSGNYGLLDQIAALEWVKANIAGFGGDPGLVTVFGQSAGAVNTCSLVGAKPAAGLFHRAIVQSGACTQPTLARLSSTMSEPLVENLGCADDPDVPACLRALAADAIIKTAPDGYPNVAGLEPSWGPHVDGVVLPTTTLAAMEAGQHNAVPLMIGATSAETGKSVPPLTEAQYMALVNASFGPYAAMVLAAYPVAEYGGDATMTYIALSSDAKFVCQARRSARAAVAKAASPVFRYHFTYDAYTTLPNDTPLAFHGLELIYIFRTWEAVLDGNFEYQPNADDLTMAATMGDAWARFAASGDPAGPGLTWAEYDAAKDNAAILDVPPSTLDGVRTDQCDFWDMILP